MRILRDLEAEPSTPWLAYGLARLRAALGNRDEALRWLAFEPPHAFVAWGAVGPEFQPYLDDPRLQALLLRMNLQMQPGDPYPVAIPAR